MSEQVVGGQTRYASFGARFGAGVLDTIIATLGGGLFGFAIGASFGNSQGVMVSAQVATFLSIVLYYLVCLGNFGRTVGYAVTGCKLVKSTTGQLPSIGSVVIWYLTYLFLGGIGWLWYFFDARHRMLHNIFSGTIVVAEA